MLVYPPCSPVLVSTLLPVTCGFLLSLATETVAVRWDWRHRENRDGRELRVSLCFRSQVELRLASLTPYTFGLFPSVLSRVADALAAKSTGGIQILRGVNTAEKSQPARILTVQEDRVRAPGGAGHVQFILRPETRTVLCICCTQQRQVGCVLSF